MSGSCHLEAKEVLYSKEGRGREEINHERLLILDLSNGACLPFAFKIMKKQSCSHQVWESRDEIDQNLIRKSIMIDHTFVVYTLI